MGRIIHVEITAEDVDRAAAFYTAAFGWRCEGSPFVDGYQLADTGAGPGVDGAIMRRSHQPQPTVAWLQVADIDAALAAVEAAGGGRVGDRNTIPGEGHVAYVRDSEGNVLGLKQPL